MVTWVDMTEEMSAVFFIDSNFKCIDVNEGIVDTYGATGDNVVPPLYLEVLEDKDEPCPGLITTDPFFYCFKLYGNTPQLR